ncbi:MAG: hypothetical protein WC404_01480 [Candidatus Omnitrophota bacterium]
MIGLFYKLAGSVILANLANTLICCINVALIYCLLLSFSRMSRIFICLIISANYSFFILSLFALTEHLHLFFILLSLFYFKRLAVSEGESAGLSVRLGLIMGVASLVRAANLYLIAGYLLALVYMKRGSREIIRFTLCSAGVFLAYQAAVYLLTGRIFPEYLAAAKTFGQARLFGGYYAFNTPVLNTTFNPGFSGMLSLMRQTAAPKLGNFLAMLNGYLGFFLWAFIPAWIYLMAKRGSREDKFFLSLAGIGILNIAVLSVSVWWDPGLEIIRYILVPYILLFIAGVYAMERLPGLKEGYKKVLLGSVFAVLFVMSSWESLDLSIYHVRSASAIRVEMAQRNRMLSWLKSNSVSSDYIATNEYDHAFPLGRPVVSLPEGKMLTPENMGRFLKVFKPRLVWISNEAVPFYSVFLGGYGKKDLECGLRETYTVFVRNND